MDDMHQIAREALEHVPPVCRLRVEDAQAIESHRDFLLALEPGVVAGFYDALYAHPVTAATLGADQRSAREQTLATWWRRTVGEPLDDDYFAWMAMVGLVHVVRNVPNPSMLAMAGYVVSSVRRSVHDAALPVEDAEALIEAVTRVCGTVAAIITFGYDHAVISALYSVAGMPEALLRRLRDQEVESALTSARSSLRMAADAS